MFGLLYLPLFLVILPLMCYWVGRLIGLGMVRVLPEWSWRLVNYPVWKRNLIGSIICIALFIFMVGDEIYGKYRIETLCKQARKELPKPDKSKLSNQTLIVNSHINFRERKFHIQIFGYNRIYINSETKQKVGEYKLYTFRNGLLVRLVRMLPNNSHPVSIVYSNYECTTKIPDLKAWNSKAILELK